MMAWDDRAGPAHRARTGLAGAALASACVLSTLLWRGELSVPPVLAALAGMLLAVLLVRRAPQSDRPSGEAQAAARSTWSASLLPDPAILVDRRNIVLEANEAAVSVLPGLRERQPLAFALRDPGVLDQIGRVAASGAPARVEFGGRRGNEPTWEVRLRPVNPEAGHGEPAVALFLRDLTAERRIEAMRVDFVANVSHELRTPLASLVGFIDTLQGPARDDPPARERFLRIMQAQAARMTRLIDDLLQLSRVELKEHLPPSERVDLGITAAHMVEVMGPLAREQGVRIRLELPEGPAEVLADRDELLRLIENLVENAIKYGRDGGDVEVTVGIRQEDRAVELAVRDHGPGIPPEHVPRLTERFYRVDIADSRARGGTGLGLAIVKHIVGRHRARLAIESEPGLGATFRVVFPQAGPG